MELDSEIRKRLINLKDPSTVYLEIRTDEDDPNCPRMLTTNGMFGGPFTEHLAGSIYAYRTEFGSFPSLSQILLAISRNLHLEELEKEEKTGKLVKDGAST